MKIFYDLTFSQTICLIHGRTCGLPRFCCVFAAGNRQFEKFRKVQLKYLEISEKLAVRMLSLLLSPACKTDTEKGSNFAYTPS